MSKKNIAVLVSGGGTNLQSLIDCEKQGMFGESRITLVVASKPGVYALERAANNNIASTVLCRKDYESIADYSKALVETLKNADIDLVVLAGFLTIIDEQVYEAYPNAIINIHPALIPSFCGKGFYGLHVHEAALAKGVKVSGATVHFVTPESLQQRIMEEVEWKILPESVKLFCEDRLEVKDNIVYIKEN